MSGTQFRCEVAGIDVLERLRHAPLPLRLRETSHQHQFHRDIYLDTPDCGLLNRRVACRLRLMADGRQWLALLLGQSEGDGTGARVEAMVDTQDPLEAVLGSSEPARRLRGLTDPGLLKPWIQFETERWSRVARSGWFRPQNRFLFVYDRCIVRAGGLTREFAELGVRRFAPGGPNLQQIATVLQQEDGVLLTGVPKHERAAAVLRMVEGEALTRALGSGRSVALLAQDEGRIALVGEDDVVKLPVARGSGDDAVRFLLRRTLGSSVGDLSFLGLAPGSMVRPAIEVWSARRIRTDDVGEVSVRWIPLAEVLSRAGSAELSDPESLAALAIVARSSPQPAAVALRQSAWSSEPTQTSAPRPGRLPPEGSKEGAPCASGPYPTDHFLNIELSQLAFNSRVLELAEDSTVPLLERLRYLSIVSSNMDEFFSVRVGALKGRMTTDTPWTSLDGLTAEAQLHAVTVRIPDIVSRQHRCLEGCLHGLDALGLRVRRWGELDEARRTKMKAYFRTTLMPELTPRALTLSPGHPFPIIPDLTLGFALMLRDDPLGPIHFAYLRIPYRVPRFVPVEGSGGRELLRVEELIRADLATLFPNRIVEQAWLFRVTRSADLDVEEEEAGDFLQAIEEEVGRRSLNPTVRIEVEAGMPPTLRALLLREFRFEQQDEPAPLSEMDLYDIPGMIDLTSLRQLAEVAGAELPANETAGLIFDPAVPHEAVDPKVSIFDAIRAGNILLHHPYDGFQTSTLRLLEQAATDPSVSTLKMTLYRAGDASPVVDALCRAAQAGKEVAVFVELKARFDESRNIAAVERMEGAGVQVIYGMVGLKNHAKIALVIRRDNGVSTRYAHVGTGNYNASTARFYTDVGLLTADAEITADLTDLFNQLTGTDASPRGQFRKLLVAPATMLDGFLVRIAREEAHARAGRPAQIRAQFNGLEDPEIIEALYRASTAGVRVQLLVRGLCILRPGVPGLSEHIEVRSVLGRYLEHSRIYHFHNGGDDEYLIGSADWRPRNLCRRVEVAVPIEDAALRARLDQIFRGGWEETRAWVQDDSGVYHRGQAGPDLHVHDRGGLPIWVKGPSRS